MWLCPERGSVSLLSALGQQETEAGICTGSTKGRACSSQALPFTRHCFQRILFTNPLHQLHGTLDS